MQIKPVNLKGNQPWIFTGRAFAEAEAPIFWLPDAKSRLIEKHPDAGKAWRRAGKGLQRMRWLVSITDSTDMNLSKFWEIVKDRGAWHAAVYGVTNSWTQLSVWTTTMYNSITINAVLCLALLLFEVTTLLAWEFITKMWNVVLFIVSEALSWLNWAESSVEYTGQSSWSWNLYTHRILINRDKKYFILFI